MSSERKRGSGGGAEAPRRGRSDGGGAGGASTGELEQWRRRGWGYGDWMVGVPPVWEERT
jgi:hypothetical protein